MKSYESGRLDLQFFTEGICKAKKRSCRNIIDLVREGAGGTLAPEEEKFLRGRYYDWIVKKKDGVPTSPQEIWDTEDGKKIQKKIKEIGKLLLGEEAEEEQEHARRNRLR